MVDPKNDIQTRCHPSCRTCTSECLTLQRLDVNGLGLVELKAASTDRRVPFACTACDLCAVVCTRRLNPGKVFRAWREEIASSDGGLPASLNPRLTDQPENLYSAYRYAYSAGIRFPEASRAEMAFFPGCALSAYTPELALAVYDYIQKRFPGAGWLGGCCYDLLDKLGLDNRYDRAKGSLVAEVAEWSVRRIITACPTCHYRLAQIFPELQVISVYQVLADERLKLPSLPVKIAVHDTCPDRFRQEIGSAVRALLPETQKIKHEGKRSLCCGAGGGVNFTNPELADEIGRRRWAEVESSGAGLLVTYCSNCAAQLARTSTSLPVAHILGLIFGLEHSYTQIAERIQGSYSGSADN
jgi:Fe-S oxidoreductase